MGKLAPFMPDPVIASRNETTIRDYVDSFNRGDFERIRAICTPNVFLSGVLGKGDFDTVLPIWQALHDAFHLELTIEDGHHVAFAGDAVITNNDVFDREFEMEAS